MHRWPEVPLVMPTVAQAASVSQLKLPLVGKMLTKYVVLSHRKDWFCSGVVNTKMSRHGVALLTAQVPAAFGVSVKRMFRFTGSGPVPVPEPSVPDANRVSVERSVALVREVPVMGSLWWTRELPIPK